PVAGGRPRRLQEQAMACECPLWTPDGKALHFVAFLGGKRDWWVASFDPSADHPVPARNGGLLAAFRRQGIGNPNGAICNRDWLGNDFIFGGSRALLQIGMNTSDWSIQGGIKQILPVANVEGLRVVKRASGRTSVVYAVTHDQTYIWGVPLAGTQGE